MEQEANRAFEEASKAARAAYGKTKDCKQVPPMDMAKMMEGITKGPNGVGDGNWVVPHELG